jgi:sugar lactone lactonase YvrE
VVADARGRLLCGVDGGRILRINPENGDQEIVGETGGRPLGLEVLHDGNVLVCDAHKGLLRLDPESGTVETLVQYVNDIPLRFCSNAMAARDGTIWFTKSSSRFDFENYMGALIEHKPSGRLFRRDLDGQVTVLLKDLYFPNGIALTEDESAVLFVETDGYRLSRLWVRGPDAGKVDLLADNLPGFPDNLSRCKDGYFWVAFVGPRSPALDRLGRTPRVVRKILWRFFGDKAEKASTTTWAMAFDIEGRVLADMQTTHQSFGGATGVVEYDGNLLFASATHNVILQTHILDLSQKLKRTWTVPVL